MVTHLLFSSMDQIVNRFLKYVSFDTQSDEASSCTPSTEKQFRLAEYLVEELRAIGLEEVEMDAQGYGYLKKYIK